MFVCTAPPALNRPPRSQAEGGPQDFGLSFAETLDLARLEVAERDLSRAEEMRVDLVEISAGRLEHLGERLAEGRRRVSRHVGADGGEGRVVSPNPERDAGAVQDGVVRAAD